MNQHGEQKPSTIPKHTSSPPVLVSSCCSILDFFVMFLDRCLSFFFWPLCCLSFFDLRFLITSFVSSQTFLQTKDKRIYIVVVCTCRRKTYFLTQQFMQTAIRVVFVYYKSCLCVQLDSFSHWRTFISFHTLLNNIANMLAFVYRIWSSFCGVIYHWRQAGECTLLNNFF